MNDLLEQYFNVVGDRACCFEDLKPYTILEGAERERWTAFLKNVPVSFVGDLIRSMAIINRLAGEQKGSSETDQRTQAPSVWSCTI